MLAIHSKSDVYTATEFSALFISRYPQQPACLLLSVIALSSSQNLLHGNVQQLVRSLVSRHVVSKSTAVTEHRDENGTRGKAKLHREREAAFTRFGKGDGTGVGLG